MVYQLCIIAHNSYKVNCINNVAFLSIIILLQFKFSNYLFPFLPQY